MVVYKHLLAVVVDLPTVGDAVAVAGKDAGRWPAVPPAIRGERRQPAIQRSLPSTGRTTPRSGSPQRKRRNGVARDALRPGSGSAKENAGLRVGERRSYARVSCLIRGCAGDEEPTHARQRNLRRNVKRPARDRVAAGRSVLILRRRCRCSTATPQSCRSGRSAGSASTAGRGDGEARQSLRRRIPRVAHSGIPCLF